MTRKHFIAAANIVSTIESDKERRTAALAFADFFTKCAARFDRTRFMEACGL